MPDPTPTPTPGAGGEHKVDFQRVLAKVQAHPTGALLVETAVQACVIEDQQKLIEGLRGELVAATSGRPDPSGDVPVPG